MVENRSDIEIASIDTVFIDLDDTLWDFSTNSKIALRHIYDFFELDKYAPEYSTFQSIYKLKNDELWELYHYGKINKDFLVNERFEATLNLIGYTKPDIIELASSINLEYLDYLAMQPTLIPFAEELLQHLSVKFKIGILSNGFKGVQAKKLQSAGIDHYIDLIVLSEDVGYTKPMKEIFDYALSCRNSCPENTLMIGDNYDADICGANNAGWKTIFFNKKNQNVENNIADITVNSLADIIELL